MLQNLVDKERVCGNCPHCKVKTKEGMMFDMPRDLSIIPEESTIWCHLDYPDNGAKHMLNSAKESLLPVHSIKNCSGITKFWNPIDEKEFELNNEDMSKGDKKKKHKVKVEDCDFL